MKSKRICLLILVFFICKLIFSQEKIDTAIVLIDSLYFRPYVICEDELKTRCTDTIYSILSIENIKNEFQSSIDHDLKNKKEEKVEFEKYLEKKTFYNKRYSCRKDYKGFEFPLKSYFYLKLMYLNIHCDSVPILEGLFYQNQKYEFYYSGLFKEYDNWGRLKTEGNYLFTKAGERIVSVSPEGIVQYGSIPHKYKNEKYGGAYIEAKKDGIWRNYLHGKIINETKYLKGNIVKNK